jgi:CsoR family transcriptional regulator, copper-sensing transcriptional repressor
MKKHKKAILRRMARLEGQVRGVIKMIEEDRYCVDVLTQTTAIRSALAQVELLVLQDHADNCVETAIASRDPEAQREKFRELVGVFERVCR